MNLILENATGRYGAAMGRRDWLPDDPAAPVKLNLRKLPMVGDYDTGGAYWGGYGPALMYLAYGTDNEGLVRVFVRAHDRLEAAAKVRKAIPGAVIRGAK